MSRTFEFLQALCTGDKSNNIDRAFHTYICRLMQLACSTQAIAQTKRDDKFMHIIHRIFRDGEVEYYAKININGNENIVHIKRVFIAITDDARYMMHHSDDAFTRHDTLDLLYKHMEECQLIPDDDWPIR